MQFKLLLVSILLILSSCQTSNPVGNKPTVDSPPPQEIVNTSQLRQNIIQQNNLATKVKFKLDNGDEAFSLKPKENGLKIEAADGSEIARLTTDETGKIKIKDAVDRTLGYVVSKDKHWKIENPEQTAELYILRQQDDGDYKLETGDRQIYRLKRRDYGWEIETPQKESLYRADLRSLQWRKKQINS